MIIQKLGLIRTPKEKLVAAILDSLRHIAPAASYHFEELRGGIYLLKIYWGKRSMDLTFNQDAAVSADTAKGKEFIASQLRSAFNSLLNSQYMKQAS